MAYPPMTTLLAEASVALSYALDFDLTIFCRSEARPKDKVELKGALPLSEAQTKLMAEDN